MKKLMSIISMTCVCFSMAFGTAMPVNAEGTGCSTCGIEDTDGSIQDTLDELLNYTEDEKNRVLSSVENSSYYQENIDFINNSDRINVYKNNTADSYFTVTYIQKDEEQVIGTLLFKVNHDYEIEKVFGTEKNFDKNLIELKDYTNNTNHVYAAQPRVECYTIRCSRYEARGPARNEDCELFLGFACNKVFGKAEPLIASMLCYAGTITICQSAPAGMYCAQLTRVNVCPY